MGAVSNRDLQHGFALRRLYLSWFAFQAQGSDSFLVMVFWLTRAFYLVLSVTRERPCCAPSFRSKIWKLACSGGLPGFVTVNLIRLCSSSAFLGTVAELDQPQRMGRGAVFPSVCAHTTGTCSGPWWRRMSETTNNRRLLNPASRFASSAIRRPPSAVHRPPSAVRPAQSHATVTRRDLTHLSESESHSWAQSDLCCRRALKPQQTNRVT